MPAPRCLGSAAMAIMVSGGLQQDVFRSRLCSGRQWSGRVRSAAESESKIQTEALGLRKPPALPVDFTARLGQTGSASRIAGSPVE